MPKLNVYVDDDLLKRVRKYNLPISQICQDALWIAIEEAEAAVCKECEQPAAFHVLYEGLQVYSCRRHLTSLLLDGVSTVRSL